jgi:HAE1 family hydrophobic/amphiphilic exporter-1
VARKNRDLSAQQLRQQQALTAAENTLKAMMLPNRNDLMWSAALVPETPLDTDVGIPTLDNAVRQALAARPEMAESGIAVDISALNARLARENTRPRIDAFANLSASGLSGLTSPALSSSPFSQFLPGLGAVPPLFPGSYSQSLSNLVNGNFPSAQVGVTLSFPLHNHAAEAQLATANAETRRLKTQQTQVATAIEADVRNALQFVQSARARFDAATLARKSAEEQYSSEQRQFQAGTSSTFLVLQRQTDMINARNRETRAHADYAESLANLDRATARTIDAHDITLQ